MSFKDFFISLAYSPFINDALQPKENYTIVESKAKKDYAIKRS